MKKLLISPSKMALPEQESQIYQTILKLASDISLNLMAIKVDNHPTDFLGWCFELHNAITERLNFDLLDTHQLPTVKKLESTLKEGIAFLQLKTLRIAPWPVVCAYVQQHDHNIMLQEHLALAKHIDSIRTTPLGNMSHEDILAFAGKHTSSHDPSVYCFDVEHFSSTKSQKGFHQLLAHTPEAFAQALAHIPNEGNVTRAHYLAFVSDYQAIFDGSEHSPTLAPATRLLAMYRPDVFTPINGSKSDALYMALGITRLSNKDFERYWDDLVCAITSMPWYTMTAPNDEQEHALAHIKALLPCFFYYFDKHSQTQSNYFKLLHKPQRTVNTSSARKRTKESASQLVDRVLSQSDLPEHIRAKRDSIISEVEKGRSVDDTISLMRTIFG